MLECEEEAKEEWRKEEEVQGFQESKENSPSESSDIFIFLMSYGSSKLPETPMDCNGYRA